MSLVVSNLEVKYGKNLILKDINLRLDKNKIVVILGKNGSGKSTLLKAITKQIKLEKGSIIIDDKSINQYNSKELAKTTSYLPQIRPNNIDLLVKDIIKLGVYPYNSLFKKVDIDLNSVLNLFNLNNLANVSYNKLSGGEKQRVFLALAYTQNPKYLLLDEPTTFLDINYQIDTLNIIKDLSKKDMGILLVLHDFNLASRYADYVYIIDDKTIKYEGCPKDIFKKEIIKDIFKIDSKIIEADGYNYLIL